MAKQITNRRVVLALAASILMFAGWVLAIVPTFHDLAGVVVVVILGLLLFALVLIPAGMDLFYPERPRPGTKRGLGRAILSVLPAVALIVLTAVVMPLAPIVAALAIAAEVLGIALYLWDWYSVQRDGDTAPHA